MVVVGNGSLTQNNCQHFMLGFSWKATNVTCMFWLTASRTDAQSREPHKIARATVIVM